MLNFHFVDTHWYQLARYFHRIDSSGFSSDFSAVFNTQKHKVPTEAVQETKLGKYREWNPGTYSGWNKWPFRALCSCSGATYLSRLSSLVESMVVVTLVFSWGGCNLFKPTQLLTCCICKRFGRISLFYLCYLRVGIYIYKYLHIYIYIFIHLYIYTFIW